MAPRGQTTSIMAQTDPLILAALGFLAIVAVVCSAYRFGFVLVVIAGMLFIASTAAPMDWLGRPERTWLTPIQNIRSYIFGALGVVTYISLLTHLGKLSLHRFSSQIVLLLLIGLYEGLIRLVTRDLTAGTLTIALRLAVVLPAAWLLPALFTSLRNTLTVLRLVGLVAAAWIGASLIQYLRDPSVLTLGGGGSRFQGMLSNPQHAAALLAMTSIVSAWLVLNDPKRRYRLLWTAVAGVGVLLLLWTGSRTGLGMCVVGAAFVFYPKLGSSILFLPFVAGAFYLGLQFITGSGSEVDFSRLLSTENTRARSWASLLSTAAAHPILGVGTTERNAFEGSENSFLYGIASFGMGMGVLILLLMLVSGVTVLRLWRMRPEMSPLERRLTDLIVAINAMYFAGSVFEGYIIARVGSPLVMLMIAGGMTRALRARLEEGVPDEFEDELQNGDGSEYSDADEHTSDWYEDEYEVSHPDESGAQGER